MFFRYIGGMRKSIDLDDIFSGSCFLLGGAPCLGDVKDKLENTPVIKFAMNNTATIVRPDLWVGADVSKNFSDSVLLDPGPMKFAYITRRDNMICGTKWKDVPNTYFMTSVEMKSNEFFIKNRDFVWDKNVFTLALQIAYRLGFRRVYLVGCSFKITQDSQYCYSTKLDAGQVRYNQRTYNTAVDKLKNLLRFADSAKLEIISCTPDSKANDILRYVPLDDALQEELAKIPPHSTVGCNHPKKPE
jgi:hypothetical protein